jgi:hypothetical protein
MFQLISCARAVISGVCGQSEYSQFIAYRGGLGLAVYALTLWRLHVVTWFWDPVLRLALPFAIFHALYIIEAIFYVFRFGLPNMTYFEQSEFLAMNVGTIFWLLSAISACSQTAIVNPMQDGLLLSKFVRRNPRSFQWEV